jgi:putative acetyltransferase
MAVVVTVEEPTSSDVLNLLERHLAFAREVTPEGGVFALDVDSLRRPGVIFFCARVDGWLVGVAALQELSPAHGELKSMHTAADARRQGVGTELVASVLEAAWSRGYERVSLETGNFDAFSPARSLYERCGFTPCDPYDKYVGSPTSACMSITLDSDRNRHP